MKRESLLHKPGLSKLTELQPIDTGPHQQPERGRDAEEDLRSLKKRYADYSEQVVRGREPTPEQKAILEGIADRILSLEE